MSSFSDHVGIRFHEQLSGFIGRGTSDPTVGAAQAEAAGVSFRCELELELASVRAFMDGPQHDARIIDGLVWWEDAEPARVKGGTVRFFDPIPGEPRQRRIVYQVVVSAVAEDFVLHGEKRLADDAASDAAADLSALWCVLGFPAGDAAGLLRSHLSGWLESLQEPEVLRADTPAESNAACKALLAFLDRQMHAVYAQRPLTFATDEWLEREQWNVLRFLARVLLPSPLPADGPTYDDTVDGMQRFLKNADAPQVKQIRTLLQVAGLLLPIANIGPKDARVKLRRLLDSESDSPIRHAVVALNSLINFAYYSHVKADALVGYQRLAHVARHNTTLPVAEEPPDREFDVIIAGTGPAGSLLAARLAEAGNSVLLLEAGPYVAEHMIGTDEILGTARLYKNSGLQTANREPGLPVLQGSCVGGGGVINNAICVPLSAHILEDWRRAGFPIADAELWQGYNRVAADLSIGDLGERAVHLNPSARYLERTLGPVTAPPVDRPLPPGHYRCLVNFEKQDGAGAGCRSTGLCNVGCGSERKRNSFQVYLTQALATTACVLVPDARVVSVDLKRNGAGYTATGVRIKLRDGRERRARGKQIVLAAGPVASSSILLRSERDGQDLLTRFRLPVGRRFSANIASPVFGIAANEVQAQSVVQISQLYIPPDGDNFVLESWFSPPGGVALAMPGYLANHAERMRKYTRLVCASPLVGTSAHGTIDLHKGRTRIRMPIVQRDLDLMRQGTLLIARAFLESEVEEVIVRCGRGRTARKLAELPALDEALQRVSPKDVHLLPMTTAHPQGGNALSEDAELSVVDENFLVRGTDNLRICDGSVFPAVSCVNPQWTIMALAHVCARRMTA
jgi:choline dehydrogenase-like flavoprotein